MQDQFPLAEEWHGVCAEVVLFTAGLEDYAKPILDELDRRYNGVFEYRLYRPATVACSAYPCLKVSRTHLPRIDLSLGADACKRNQFAEVSDLPWDFWLLEASPCRWPGSSRSLQAARDRLAIQRLGKRFCLPVVAGNQYLLLIFAGAQNQNKSGPFCALKLESERQSTVWRMGCLLV